MNVQGKNNPNYKHGKCLKCICGKRKRQGNKTCKDCDRKRKESNFKIAVSISKSYLETANILNTSRQSVTREIERLNLDISHFKGARDRFTSKDKVLCLSDRRRNGIVKSLIIRENIIEYKCNICSITEWNHNNLELQLDHINGNALDNRIENLRFLCPNCHSQTETYTGKNMKKKLETKGVTGEIE